MKKYLFLAFPILSAILYSGCCYKIKCAGDEISFIRFYGFQYEDLDSITVRKFQNGSNSTIEEYTFNFGQKQEADHVKVAVDFVQGDFDDPIFYKVFLPKTGQEFTITDLTYKDDHCKSGMCKQEFRSLDYYKVDGVCQSLQNMSLYISN
jgi:hypothetical protein